MLKSMPMSKERPPYPKIVTPSVSGNTSRLKAMLPMPFAAEKLLLLATFAKTNDNLNKSSP